MKSIASAYSDGKDGVLLFILSHTSMKVFLEIFCQARPAYDVDIQRYINWNTYREESRRHWMVVRVLCDTRMQSAKSVTLGGYNISSARKIYSQLRKDVRGVLCTSLHYRRSN
jgi:hypothetical protein